LLLQISRGCQIFQSAPGWNEQSFLATLFSLSLAPPILALSSSLRQLALPLSSPTPLLHVIPKEQKKEKENKKRRASKREREHRKKAEEDRKGGKEKNGQPQNAEIAENFQRHWLGSVSPLVRRDFSTGGTGQHLGGDLGNPQS
jgi:hypothetical protein